MKTTLAVIGAVSLVACDAFGQGADIIIRQRAKELSNQNNVRQGVAPPTQPAQAAQPAATAAAPSKSQGLARLEADLAAIKADAPVAAEHKNKITGDIIAAAESVKPSQAGAAKLHEGV